MERFHIIQADPMQYREQILKFWEAYLPMTPPQRFEWLNQGNPAGAAIWVLAFNRKNNELAGVISVMPKEIILEGQTVRGGILGDFMVSNKYRVFGPNLQLPKTVLSHLSDLGFNFLYTIPNPESEKIMKRVGFRKAGVMYNLVKLLKTKHYLNKYLNSFAGRLMSPFTYIGLKIISRETYVSAAGVFEETAVIDEIFDLLWNKIKLQQPHMIGDHSPSYITWRYLQNPLYKFRVLTYKEEFKGDLLGFIIFTIDQGKLYIFDIIAVERTYIHRLLKRIVSIARSESCLSINIDVFETNPLLPILKSFRFFDARGDIAMYSFGEQSTSFQDCSFFGGDRNI
jgi:predicted acetyltransferase